MASTDFPPPTASDADAFAGFADESAVVRDQDQAAADGVPLVTVSSEQAATSAAGISEDQKLALKAAIQAGLAENRSWARLHEVMTDSGFVYQVGTNEKAGKTYRGATIYQVFDDGKRKFALKAGDIGYSLVAMEKQLGAFVTADQIGKARTDSPKDLSSTTGLETVTSTQPSQTQSKEETTSKTVIDNSASVECGQIGKPDEGPRIIGKPNTPPPQAAPIKTGSTVVEWSSRLQEIESQYSENLVALKGNVTGSALARLESVNALETISKRARVNIHFHPRAAYAHELDYAPEEMYRSAGTRFDHDRLMRELANMQIFETNSHFGSAVFIGRRVDTPAFYDLGESYKFTALTGVKPDAMKLALMASQKRWGCVQITGNEKFQEAALRAAAEMNIPISNPELQARWQELREDYAREAKSRETNFAQELKAAPIAQHHTLIAFNRTASLLSLDDLQKAPDRSTREFFVRGQFTVNDKNVIVLEDMNDKLHVVEATSSILKNGIIAQCETNGIWMSGISLTTGNGKPADIKPSAPINMRIDEVATSRQKGIPQIVTTEVRVEQNKERWDEAKKTLVDALVRRHWLGPTVMAATDALTKKWTPTPPKTQRREDPKKGVRDVSLDRTHDR